MTTITHDQLFERATILKLYGLLTHWDEVIDTPWLEPLILWEEAARQQRSLERRLRQARLGRFKPLLDFDWQWPKQCDRDAIQELMTLSFLKEAANAVFVGPNGVGKSTIARNIAYQAVLQGHTVLFTTAGEMLNILAGQDGDNALRRRLRFYAQPSLLVIDEVGYLSYSNRHADLLFEIISRRYEEKSVLITTNRPFSEWGEVFPNAACVVSLVDRLVHNAEIIQISGESYRLKEAKERAEQRKKKRTAAKRVMSKKDSPKNKKDES
jgi:DNA replication protein DnaC